MVDRPELDIHLSRHRRSRRGGGRDRHRWGSPVLARRLRELIEALLPARVGELAELIGRHRGRFAAIPRAISPRRFWQSVVAGPIAEAVLAGRSAQAEAQLAAAIDGHGARRDGGHSKTETVFLVGAGPGDPDL